MADPERLDLPTGTPMARPSWCSGALYRVSRAEYRELERSGIRWATRFDDIPAEGRGDARVSCRDDELALERGGARYGYGLCASCGSLESERRRLLRDSAKQTFSRAG